MCRGRNHSRTVNRLGTYFFIPLLAILLLLPYGMSSPAYGAVTEKSTLEGGDEKSVLQQKILNLQIPFVANQGQIKDKNIRFHAQTMGGSVYISHDGQMTYFFPQTEKSKSLVVKEGLVNITGMNLKGGDPSITKVNYILGNDQKKWKTDLDTFNTVNFGEVYHDIDFDLKALGNTIEKIFTVKPGADPRKIQLAVYGNDGLFINTSGELEVCFGKEKISFSKPIAFQNIEGRKTSVTVAYHLKDGGYGFDVGKYDTAHPLIIDPSLVYVSYLGGDSDDAAYDIAIDGAGGYIYIAGSTYSSNFLDGEDSDTTTFGDADAFVVKLSKDGTEVDRFTYLGGAEDDFCYGMALGEKNGEIYIYLTGQTQSKKFPTTQKGYDRKIGGKTDAWFAVLNAEGLKLATGSYLGGGGADTGFAVSVDSEGNAYVTGETLSSSFPIPDPGVPFANSKGGVDAFVAKFSFTDDGWCDLLYSTYIGGNGDDRGLDIAVKDATQDNGERIYVTGQTASPDLYNSDDSFLPALNGSTDAYLAIFQYNPDADKLEIHFLSYIGGTGNDSGEAIVIDGNEIYVAGWTELAGNFEPQSSQDYDFNGETDGFVIRVNDGDARFNSCTAFLDWSSDDRIYGLAVDADKNLITTGETVSDNLSGTTDVFVAEVQMGVEGSCDPVESISTYGGSDNDVGNGISFDAVGNIYLTGTSYGFAEEETSNQDAFLAMLCEDGDADGVCDSEDNCPGFPNGPLGGTCTDGDLVSLGKPCDKSSDCGPAEYALCSMEQENYDMQKEIEREMDYPYLGDACDTDDDDDGMPDWWEVTYRSELDPHNDSDWDDDPDGDGLFNLYEFENDKYDSLQDLPDDWSTNPLVKDSDSDGWGDLMEVQAPTDPTFSEDMPGSEIFELGIYVVDPEKGDDNNLGTDKYPLVSIHAAIDRVNLLEPWPDPNYLEGSYKVLLVPGMYMPERNDGGPEIVDSNYWVEPDTPLVINQNVIITRHTDYYSGEIIFSPKTFNENEEVQIADNWKSGFIFSPGLEKVTLQHVTISDFDQGVIFDTTSGCATFEFTRIEYCKEAIRLIETTQLQLKLIGSILHGCGTGINIETISSNNTIIGGSLEYNDVGIEVMGGSDNILIGSTIYGSSHDYGILLQPGAESFTVRNSIIEGLNVGLGFKTDGSRVTLEGTTIQGCVTGVEFLENYLIQLDMLTYDNKDTLITTCAAGIKFRAGSSNNIVTGGLVELNYEGIVFEACNETPDDNQIIGTKISGNTHRGVAIIDGFGNHFEDVEIICWEPDEASEAICSETGVYIGPNAVDNVISGGKVGGSMANNFDIDGSQNQISSVIISSSGRSGLGEIAGDTILSDLSIVKGDSASIYGMIIDGSGNIVLDGLSISEFDVGIGFSTDAACVLLSRSSITDCGIGIDIRENYMLDIDLGDTEIFSCETGVRIISGSSNNTVRNGTIRDNSGDGIRIEGCLETPDDNTIIGVSVENNDRNGIAIFDGFNNQVINSYVSGNNLNTASGGYGGIVLLNGTGSIKRSRILNNGCNGIYMDEAAKTKIIGNLIYGNKDGIQLGFTNGILVESNTIVDNGCSGLWIREGASPDVQYNILYRNGLPGSVCDDEDPIYTRSHDIYLDGSYSPEKLFQNDIGKVNQIDLPPSNILVDPKFVDSGSDPYALQSSSFCIDATTKEVSGFDILGLARPKGNSWDMGAYESSSFLDADDDGLPDVWEKFYFDGVIDCDECGAEDDFDLDGVSNIQEYREDSDPTNPLYIEIVNPANNPAFSGDGTIFIGVLVKFKPGIVVAAVTANGVDLAYNDETLLYEGSVSNLASGHHFIEVNVTAQSGANPDKDNITVIVDSESPVVNILYPTLHSEFITALDKITLNGLASDDTQVTSVAWENIGTGKSGAATGTSSWTAGPIDLNPNADNTIIITADDDFDNSGSDQIVITVSQIAKEAGVYIDDSDMSEVNAIQSSSGADPRDVDGDLYTNDDEVACGSDPLSPCIEGVDCPINYFIGDPIKEKYPVGHDKQEYKWPNCLRDDIDGDDLPNWWEDEIPEFDDENEDSDFEGHTTGLKDGDENLDGDAFTNLEEYENGTDPNEPQFKSFLLEVIGTAYSDWLPQFGQTLTLQAEWVDDDNAPAVAIFSLNMTSNYPGRAVNDPDPSQLNMPKYPTWYYSKADGIDNYHGPDFGLTAVNPATDPDVHSFHTGEVSVRDDGDGAIDGKYTIYLQCWDYGGKTKVLVTDPVTGDHIGQLSIPLDENRNGIGDKWEMGISQSLNPNADVDAIIFDNPGTYTAPLGDDFNNFEEYRGIVFIPTGSSTIQNLRLNPLRKDLFIRTEGFDDIVEIGAAFDKAGIVVHDTTGWGHDATDDNSFFIYLSEGAVTIDNSNIMQPKVLGAETGWSEEWPRHEWEFQLYEKDVYAGPWVSIGNWAPSEENNGVYYDVLYLNYPYTPGLSTYRIRKPLPHINVLIIRNESAQGGHIQFLGASSPSQQNPTGTRSWRWATKGYAWTNLPENRYSMYGLAVALRDPLYNYFNDVPYREGSTWISPGWDDTAGNGKLDSLNQVEDQSDLLSPIDGIMGDPPNDAWDGDRRLPFGEWGKISTDMSPFDIDHDGLVELPIQHDPAKLVKGSDPDTEFDPLLGKDVPIEYDMAHVLKHTITHEIGHALGGPIHTSDPTCLMYKYSKNWRRADQLSDYFKSLLRVHNKTR